MSVQNSATLKSYFQTGDQPTQAQFGDQIDTIFLGTPLDGGTSTGAANTYNFNVDGDLTSMTIGQVFSVVAHQTNAGPCTSSINSITPLNITKNGSTALAAGDITLGAAMMLYFDGGQLQLTNPSTSTSTGTVASVGLSMPAEFTVAGSPITSSGTLAVTKVVQTANTFYAGPGTGVASSPAFRTVQSADLPTASTSSIGGVQLATAAVTKTATDTSMPAAVGTLANHPGIAKAWANFVGTGAVGACTINGSYNVASVVKNSSGDYTMTFTAALSDANYVLSGSARYNSGALVAAVLGGSTNNMVLTTASIRFQTGNTTNGNPQDCPQVFAVIHGNF